MDISKKVRLIISFKKFSKLRVKQFQSRRVEHINHDMVKVPQVRKQGIHKLFKNRLKFIGKYFTKTVTCSEI